MHVFRYYPSHRIAAVLLALVALLVMPTVLTSDAPPQEQRHTPPTKAAAAPLAAVGADYPGAAVAFVSAVAAEQERIERERVEAELAAQAARQVATPSAAGAGSCAGDVACFLECTIDHESRTSGVYGAVSPSGTYRGAYQFAQATWDAAVAGAGFAEYVGVPPDQAPPAVQDAAAAHLYSVSGNRPWGGRC